MGNISKSGKKQRKREKESDNFLALLPPVHRKEGNKKKKKEKKSRGACLAAEALDMHGMAGGPLHGWFRTAGPAGLAFLLAGPALFFLFNPFLDLALDGNNPFK